MLVGIQSSKEEMMKLPGMKKETLCCKITTQSGSHTDEWVSKFELGDLYVRERKIAENAAKKNGGAS